MEMKSTLEPQGNNTVQQTLYLSSLCFTYFIFTKCHIQYEMLRISVHDTNNLAALIEWGIAKNVDI